MSKIEVKQNFDQIIFKENILYKTHFAILYTQNAGVWITADKYLTAKTSKHTSKTKSVSPVCEENKDNMNIKQQKWL